MTSDPHHSPASAPTDDDRYGRILRRATQAFLSHGYAGTSVETVAIDVGVSKLTIYSLFKDKLGLAKAVLQGLSSNLEVTCRATINDNSSIEECLINFGAAYVRWMLQDVGRGMHHYGISKLLIEMSSTHPGFSQSWLDSVERVIVTPLSEYIDEHIRRGELSGETGRFLAGEFIGNLFHASPAIVLQDRYSYLRNEDALMDLMRRKVGLFLRGCATSKLKPAR